MSSNWVKFRLLLWKNWKLQVRHRKQTLVEILAPVFFTALLVLVRCLVVPVRHDSVTQYPPFLPSVLNETYIWTHKPVAWSPAHPILSQIMELASKRLGNATFVPFLKEDDLINNLTSPIEREKYLAGIIFDVSDPQNLPEKLTMTLRFPGESQSFLQEQSPDPHVNWKTNLMFPIFQANGPREVEESFGGMPYYYSEGFLTLQEAISVSLIAHISGKEILDLPRIQLQRYPYGKYIDDQLLIALRTMISLIMLLSFVYTCVSTVKIITVEKEYQLKEAMKIMGLPSWLHWTAWFLKILTFLILSIIFITILFKVQWGEERNISIFTLSNGVIVFIFLLCYMISTICFCFMVSVFFSKANTAATVAGLTWFLSYAPFQFVREEYAVLTVNSKMAFCLAHNTAMAYGLQLFVMFEGTGEGIQWHNIWKSPNLQDTFSLGHVLIMLVADSIIYLLITLYIETVFPGDYGVPRPWNFFIQKSYWCGNSYSETNNNYEAHTSKNNSSFEKEPLYLKPGIQIRNLRKVFKRNKIAVDDVSLNMFEDQITVLLGHNGAGKTTTMLMLTGMLTPTNGTAIVNDYDIQRNIDEVRSSLGLCPQHNVLFDELTVREHLYFFGKLKGLNDHDLLHEINKYISLLDLVPKADCLSKNLSGGMKRKLSAGIAFCGNSKVVLFDEPTSGMDPAARRALWDLIQSEKKGRTILLTTHFMDEADLLGDRIAIMAGGKLQCCGSSFFLKKKYGAGYNLIIVKAKICDVNKITIFLQKHIPNLRVNQDIGSELSYTLYADQVKTFERMFQDLEMNKDNLGILSYGVSLTTMEEVFMRVGMDEDTEPDKFNINEQNHNGKDSNLQLLTGWSLKLNQLRAMFSKKILYALRTWPLLVIMIIIPAVFLIVLVLSLRRINMTDLPPLTIDLENYVKPNVFLGCNSKLDEFQEICSYYRKMLSKEELIYLEDNEANISSAILKQGAENILELRQKYIVSASFGIDSIEGNHVITGWFNDQPYHSPPLTLNLIINSMLQYFATNETSLKVINHPLPFRDESKISLAANMDDIGFQYGFNIGFSMAFISAFFVLLCVKERVSKAKLLQFVSGVDVFSFWLPAFFWDFIQFLGPSVVLIIMMIIFPEQNFETVDELGRVFVMLLLFAWAMLPLMYLSSFFFSVPSTGFSRMAMLNVFCGVGLYLVVSILKFPTLHLDHVAKILEWIFMIVPHFSLCSSIRNLSTNKNYQRVCVKLETYCPFVKNPCCKDADRCPSFGCVEWSEDFFDWKSPGIGREVFFLIFTGIIYTIIVLMYDLRIFEMCNYAVRMKLASKVDFLSNDDEDYLDDIDVRMENDKISNIEATVYQNEYRLLIKELTKYYGNFLAVNKLSIGVHDKECFGLLGVNGAGKTTTFKMLTGDIKISSGDAYVDGLSLKTNMKKVYQLIGYCPQFDGLIEDLTGREILYMFCLLRGIPPAMCSKAITQLSEELLFQKHIDKKVKNYSGGNKRKLSTAVALVGDPSVIYLDEPTTGMDPVAKRHLWNVICKIRNNGKCIILTSHSMEECEALCTRLAIMVNGRFKCLGSPQHLKNKFAKGYTLTVKMKISDKMRFNDTELNPIKDFIKTSFPGSTLREEYQGLLTYYVQNPTLTWSRMFGMMEDAKTSFNIEDYSLGQTSLEQVFLSFTRHQRES